LTDRLLTLTRLSREEGLVTLALHATSNNDTIGFEINVIMHYVYDDVDENEMEMMSIYPNPTHGAIFIGANNDLLIQQVEVFNVTGQMVLSSSKTEINMSELESGMYFIRVTADDRIVIRSIVKQ